MNSVLHGTIEEPGPGKDGIAEAPSGGAWFALDAVLFIQHWLRGPGEHRPIVCGPRSSNVINAAAARSVTPNGPLGSDPASPFAYFLREI